MICHDCTLGYGVRIDGFPNGKRLETSAAAQLIRYLAQPGDIADDGSGELFFGNEPVEREDRHRAGQGEHPRELRAGVRVVEVDRVFQHDGRLRHVDPELVHRAADGGPDLVGELGGQAVGGDGGLARVVLGSEQAEIGELTVAVGVGRARHRGGLVDIPEHHGGHPPTVSRRVR